jgi:hypothetical protein
VKRERIVYPLKVSENGRYFVDQAGTPVFWLGTTQWGIVRDYTLDEATLILDKTARIGFAFAQVMLLGPGKGGLPSVGLTPNVDGERPWIDNDPLSPNEAHFRHVDAEVEIACEKNVVWRHATGTANGPWRIAPVRRSCPSTCPSWPGRSARSSGSIPEQPNRARSAALPTEQANPSRPRRDGKTPFS